MLVGALLLSGCQTIGYYGQLANGQLSIMFSREDIDELLDDPATDPALAERLQQINTIIDFAERELDLSADGSYRSFAEIDRDAATWIVVAAPEFSLEPRLWCFPIAGCVPYRGYFSERAAQRKALKLRAEGLDVSVYPTAAYSTLGWFRDPVLSSMLDWDEATLVETLFHELAHQKLYAPDNSSFNEAFATAVGRAGARRWYQNQPARLEAYERQLQAQAAYGAVLSRTRDRLQALYAQPLDAETMRARKAAIFADAGAGLDAGSAVQQSIRHWLERDPNNADLALHQTYEHLVVRFEQLLAENGGDLPAFYADAATIADYDAAQMAEWAAMPRPDAAAQAPPVRQNG